MSATHITKPLKAIMPAQAQKVCLSQCEDRKEKARLPNNV